MNLFYKLTLFILAPILVFQCKKKDEEIVNSQSQKSDKIYMCTTKDHDEDISDIHQRTSTVLVNSKRWTEGSVLTVKFMNGDAFLQSKVRYYAGQWSRYCNIYFKFINSGDAQIRIKFDTDGKSWSLLGKDALSYTQDKETMHFGWFDHSTPDNEFSRVVLHEFGHAIGLHHEFLSPLSTVPWDRNAVYAYYLGEGWTKESIDYNILNLVPASEATYSAFDTKSIMMYDISNALTIGDYEVPTNYILSATDKSSIGGIYSPAAAPWKYYLGEYGAKESIPCPADYDGDKSIDFAIKDPVTGGYYIDYSTLKTDTGTSMRIGVWDFLGNNYAGSSKPCPADYDGDGKADISTRDVDGTWRIDYSKNGFGYWDWAGYQYGAFHAFNCPADYDGDGKADFCIKDGQLGTIYIDYAYNGFKGWDITRNQYGGESGKPCPADFDGDKKADFAMKDVVNGKFYIDYSRNGLGTWDWIGNDYAGNSLPYPADFDGDGKADIATLGEDQIFRIDFSGNSFGSWDKSITGMGMYNIGCPGDYNGNGKADIAVRNDFGYLKILTSF
jgi:hypothetical protein